MFVNSTTDGRVVTTNTLDNFLSDISASCMPMICHRTAFESGEEPILHPEQKNQQLPVLAMFRK
jgi:hypothetical protein